MYKNCPIEMQRYAALLTWANLNPTMNIDLNNIVSYLDSRISAAQVFQSNVKFNFLSLTPSFSNFYIQSSQAMYSYNPMINQPSFSILALDSNELKVNCHFNMVNQQISLASLDLTFIFDQSNSYNLYVNLQEMSSAFSNG